MNHAATNQGTAADLLRAARRLFASHGYDGTSVREITTAAGANLGAITYHFGSKQELYHRIVSECSVPLAEAVIAALAHPEPVLGRVARVVRAYFDQLSSDEDTGRIMLQAIVIGKEPAEAANLTMRRVHAALHALVVEGQRQGSIRAGDPRLLSLSIVSVPLHLVLIRRALKVNALIDLDDPVERERAILHAVRFICEALATHPGDVT